MSKKRPVTGEISTDQAQRRRPETRPHGRPILTKALSALEEDKDYLEQMNGAPLAITTCEVRKYIEGKKESSQKDKVHCMLSQN